MASLPFTINRRPSDDDDTDVKEENAISSSDREVRPTWTLSRSALLAISETDKLQSKEQFLEFPSKVFAYINEAEAELGQSIDTLILDLVLSYSSHLLSPTLKLRTVGGCFGVSRDLSMDSSGFVIEVHKHPKAQRVNVRANICAPTKNGKYYFELDIAGGFTHAVGGVGWCDDLWTGRVDEGQVDTSQYGDDYVPFAMIGEDAHSWAIDRNGQKFHNAMSDIPPNSAKWVYADERGARGYPGKPYCRKWKGNEIIGCGIERTEAQSKMTFFLNGEPMGVAWADCVGKSIYPACTFITGDDHHLYSQWPTEWGSYDEFDEDNRVSQFTFIFVKDYLVHLPKGYAPVYEKM